MQDIKVGILGAGKWGMNHVKTALKILGAENLIVCDTNFDTKEKLDELDSAIKFATEPEIIFNDDSVNCVIIATPVETHFDLSLKALRSNKHVLVEKPITLKSVEAEELNRIAKEKELKLMVGHVLLFHPAVLKMKEMVINDELGTLQYIYSNRLNLGTIRKEENILWSFAPHDISVIQYLAASNPIAVSAKGADFIRNDIEDVTLTVLTYAGNLHAHIFVSWLHPFKEQRMVVIGSKGMIVFEDSAKENKLKFYKKGFADVNGEPEKFDEDFVVVEFGNRMPLEEEQKHFFGCIKNGADPVTNGDHAIEVLKILEEAQDCLKRK